MNFRFMLKYTDVLFKGMQMTIFISLLSIIFGFTLGLLLALMKESKNKTLNIIAVSWVEFFRNTPFLVQLFFLFYGLPELGIDTNPVVVAIIALSMNSSAGNCESIRSGFLAIKKSLYEVSYSLGFNVFQTYRLIIIPVALRLSFRTLTNNFINLVLTSSVVFAVTVEETNGVAKTIASATSKPFEIYVVILLAYCVLTFAISYISKLIEKRIAINL